HEGALTGRQSLKVFSTQVIGHEIVEPIFAFFRRKFFDQRQAAGVRDVCNYLATQCAVANRLQSRFESIEHLGLAEIGKLFAKALQVAENVFVDEANESEQFEQRILKRRRREQQFVFASEGQLESVRDDVRWLVNIA